MTNPALIPRSAEEDLPPWLVGAPDAAEALRENTVKNEDDLRNNGGRWFEITVNGQKKKAYYRQCRPCENKRIHCIRKTKGYGCEGCPTHPCCGGGRIPRRDDEEESWNKLVAAQMWGQPFSPIAIRQGTKHLKRRKVDDSPSSTATPPAPTPSTSARPVTPPPPGARELLEWEFYHRQTRDLRLPEILPGAGEEYALDVVRWVRWMETHREDLLRRADQAIEYLRTNFGTEDFD